MCTRGGWAFSQFERDPRRARPYCLLASRGGGQAPEEAVPLLLPYLPEPDGHVTGTNADGMTLLHDGAILVGMRNAARALAAAGQVASRSEATGPPQPLHVVVASPGALMTSLFAYALEHILLGSAWSFDFMGP